jgi:hypothetical protein
MNGGIGLGGFIVNTQLEGIVPPVYCQIEVCDGTLNFSGGSEEQEWLH